MEKDWNECIYCERTIYLDDWGRWKHWHTKLILCQPDECLPGFTGIEGATPGGSG